MLRERWLTLESIDLTHPRFAALWAIGVGLIVGGIMAAVQQMSVKWALLITMAVMAPTFVLIFGDLKKLFLMVFVIDIPLGLDISVGPLYSDHQGGPLSFVVSLSTMLLPVAYALWLLEDKQKSQAKIQAFLPITIPAIIYIFSALISLLQSTNLTLSLFELFLTVKLFIFYFYIANNIRSWQELGFVMAVYSGALMVESWVVILQAVTGIDLGFLGLNAVSFEGNTESLQEIRAGGTLGGANVAGAYLASALTPTIAAFLLGNKLTDNRITMAAIPFAALALLSTGSRGGWIGLALGASVVFAVALIRRINTQAIIAAAIIGMVMLGIFSGRIITRLTGDDGGSAESRIYYNQLAWNIIDDNYWLGVGINNFDIVKWSYLPPELKQELREFVFVVHNKYLLVWAHTGIFGFLAFVFVPVSAMIYASQWIRQDSDVRAYIMGASFLGAILGFSFHMNFDIFDSRQELMQLWLLFALTASLRQIHDMNQIRNIPLELTLEPSSEQH